MPRHYLTDAIITLLPALIAGAVGYLGITALARIGSLVNGAGGTPMLLAHAALPFATVVVIVWVINFTEVD